MNRPDWIEYKGDQLFPYQIEGGDWLATLIYGLLADEMGLGKSCQAIRASDTLPFPILVLCPAIARHNWRNEFWMFSTRQGPVRIGIIVTREDIEFASQCDIVICSYDLAIGEENALGSDKPLCNIIPQLARRRWSVAILDEMHILKNRSAKRTSAVFESLRPYCDRMWALSGTPAPNYPNELWPMMRAFGITKLPYWDFVKRYCKTRTTQWRTEITGGQRIDELRKILAPFVKRRRKDDVLKDLPPLRYTDVVLEPGTVPVHKWEYYFQKYIIDPSRFAGDMELMERLLDDAMDRKQVLNEEGDIEILSVLSGRVQDLRRWIGLQKVYSLVEFLKYELGNFTYEKIILFAVHKDVIKELDEGLKAYSPVVITGETPHHRRVAAVDKFQNNRKHRVFIGNILAAGTAITLTAASEVGMVECDWVPGNNAQAIMRAHRIGQTKPVNVRFFSLANSVDQKIQAVYKRKARTLTELFDQPVAPDETSPTIDPFAE